jgi:2-(3-amino-3-carboxypropyl)histidine synthase
MFEGYYLDLQRIIDWVNNNGYRAVGIQLPEGLKMRHKVLAEAIESTTEAVTVFIGDPCFGACDLADAKVEALGLDALVHIGHTPLKGDLRVPIHFEPLESTIPVDEAIKKAIPLLTPPVGLLTTAQHLRALERSKALLKEAGLDPRTAKGTRASRDGQVLGCSYMALHRIEEEVGSFLFVGSGRFHPLGAALSTTKRVIAADPYLGEVEDMAEAKERMLRRRHGLITKAKDAASFIVVVSTKSGQRRMALATGLRKLLLDHLRAVTIVAMENMTPENMMGLEGEVIVSTACPRVALDDQSRFDRPVLTPIELEIALGQRQWDDYSLDEF